MKYMVIEKGSGEGCDYTIGCNMRFEIREHPSHDVSEVIVDFAEEAAFDGETEYHRKHAEPVSKHLFVTDIWVVPLSQCLHVDVEKLINAHNEWAALQRAKKDEEKERLEYERLKKKFG